MARHYTLIRHGDIKTGEHAGGVLYTCVYHNYSLLSFYFIDKEGLDNRNLVQTKMNEAGFKRYYCFEFDAELTGEVDYSFAWSDPKEITEFIEVEFKEID